MLIFDRRYITEQGVKKNPFVAGVTIIKEPTVFVQEVNERVLVTKKNDKGESYQEFEIQKKEYKTPGLVERKFKPNDQGKQFEFDDEKYILEKYPNFFKKA